MRRQPLKIRGCHKKFLCYRKVHIFFWCETPKKVMSIDNLTERSKTSFIENFIMNHKRLTMSDQQFCNKHLFIFNNS